MTKLDRIREYVENMSPVIRIAILFPPEIMAEHRGYDKAMHRAQQDLLEILDDKDD